MKTNSPVNAEMLNVINICKLIVDSKDWRDLLGKWTSEANAFLARNRSTNSHLRRLNRDHRMLYHLDSFYYARPVAPALYNVHINGYVQRGTNLGASLFFPIFTFFIY